MSQQGPSNGVVGADEGSVGGSQTWTGSLAGGATASFYSNAATAYSSYFDVTSFGFTIPAGATVTGFRVILNDWFGAYQSIGNVECTLWAGARIGTAKTAHSAGQQQQFGGPADMWGASPSLAQINATTFGVSIRLDNNSQGTGIYRYCTSVTLTVFYTPVSQVQSTVTLQAAVGLVVGTVRGSVSLAAAVARIVQAPVALSAAVGFTVAITNPTVNQTITTSALLVQWTLGQNILQNDFRVRVWADVNQTILVYDSGVVLQSAQQWLIPQGILPGNSTLYVEVGPTDSTSGVSASSVLTPFITSFPTAVNVTGVKVAPVGGCTGDPRALPTLRVAWNQVTPGGGETFLEYDILRRVAGVGRYQRVGIVAAVGTTFFIDDLVAPSTRYEYVVVYLASNSGNVLNSAYQSPAVSGKIDFDFNFVHDPADNTFVRLDGWTFNVALDQPVRYAQPWGRPTPTAHVGQAFNHLIQATLTEQMLKDTFQRTTLEALFQRQRDTGATFCLRLGRARERYFVTTGAGSGSGSTTTRGMSRAITQKQYVVTVDFQESFYVETV